MPSKPRKTEPTATKTATAAKGPKRPRRAKPRQGELVFRSWGGLRQGAGRKPVGKKAGMPHCRRAEISRHHPVHVTIRVGAGLPSLRRKPVLVMIREALHRMIGREGFRVVAYSIQSNHMHLVVECDSRSDLAEGMRSLQIRIARGVNRLWGRRGRVFADRYHDHVLQTPSEVRHALCYVVNNHYKHGYVARLDLDRYASGAWFGGWKQKFSVEGKEGIPEHVSLPETWLCRLGWRRRGLISLDEEPRLARVVLPRKLRTNLARHRRRIAGARQ